MPPLAIRTEGLGCCYLATIDTTRDRPSEYSEAPPLEQSGVRSEFLQQTMLDQS